MPSTNKAGGGVTFMAAARIAAYQESRALRGYARYGWPVPRCRPMDLWAEWERLRVTNRATFTRRAA